MQKKKIILILLIILIVMTLIIIYVRHSRSLQVAPDAISVEVEPVKKNTIPIQVQAIGTLTAEKEVQITAEVAGRVESILFQDGTFVKKGTPLIQLDDKVNRAKLESAKANLFYSLTNYNRMVSLGKTGAVTRQAVDQAQADLKEKKALAEESQVTVDKMQLKASFDGRVGKSNVSVGDYVIVGEALVSLVDVEHLRVEYSVPEKYLPSLKLHQPVQLTTSIYPGKLFSGKVDYISPTINAENRTITLYASIPNSNELLTAGLFVTILHSLGVEENALLISATSLVPTIDGQIVYKIVNGKAMATPVTLGQRTTDYVQIEKGLSENDNVVIAGQQKLKDGNVVTIISKKHPT